MTFSSRRLGSPNCKLNVQESYQPPNVPLHLFLNPDLKHRLTHGVFLNLINNNNNTCIQTAAEKMELEGGLLSLPKADEARASLAVTVSQTTGQLQRRSAGV